MTLSDANKGKEVPSQPDFVLHVGEESPTWAKCGASVRAYAEHQELSAVAARCLECIPPSTFPPSPLWDQPCAYVCYADHSCAMYSKPLDFVKNNQHTQLPVNFL